MKDRMETSMEEKPARLRASLKIEAGDKPLGEAALRKLSKGGHTKGE